MMKWNFIVFVVAVSLYCWKSEYFRKISPVRYSVNLPADLDGPLAVNENLEKAEKLFENVLFWPESFAVKDGNIYTGLGDGRIVKIINDKMATVVRTGKECAGQHEEHICGRPLGMEFSKDGLLYVVDAYHGLFSVDVKTAKKTNLLPSTKEVFGFNLTFLNDLAIDDEQGVIYMTQSSTKWSIGMVVIGIIEHESSGRLLKYNMKTKEVSLILSGMSFPNGVEFSHDRSALLIAEGNKNKIFKYHLQGKKKGLYTDLPFVLPGEPDNISKRKGGTYWVGVANARSLQTPALHDSFADKPLFRAVFLQVYKGFATLVGAILRLIPDKRFKEIAFNLESGRFLVDVSPQHGIIVEFDESGTIIQSLHSPSGQFSCVSEVLEHNGYLYLGSWRKHFLGRLKL